MLDSLTVTRTGPCGAKAATLAELRRSGIPVPEFVVIPPGSPIPPPQVLLRELGGSVAVRSSATLEDLTDASFAGQFRSFLNIRDPEALVEAIGAVRESVRSESVRFYCASKGLDPDEIQMAVIVQRMVRADVAGVLFTVHPLTGREDEMHIEAVSGLAEDLLSGRARPNASLTDGQIRRLKEMGRRIQRLKGAPQDIEFAFEGDALYILQARPITKLCFAGIEGEWTTADFRDGGVSSDVVTPLVWSLYDYVFEKSLPGYLREIKLTKEGFTASRLFFGRPYWNLGAVKQCLRKLPGFVEREFDLDLAVKPRYTGDGIRTPMSLWNIVRALPSVWAIERILREQEKIDLRLMSSAFTWGSLKELVEGPYLTVEDNYFRTIYCASMAKMDFKSAVEGLDVDYAALVGGLDDLRYFECAQDLWQLGNGGPMTLERFLERWGYYSRRVLDLRVPRWSEEPEFVREMAQKMRGAESPAEMNRRQRGQFEREVRKLPKKARAKLAVLRRYLWLREQMRDLSTRMYAEIRRAVLPLGEDAFYMTWQELCEGGVDRRKVRERREYEEMYRAFRPPNEIGRGYDYRPTAGAAKRLVGIACSSGVVTGQARVVRRPEEGSKLGRGDILVCPFTDPGWTPLLNVVGGVVTETGGLLSHAAVICREYGIPAVLNVADVTRVLRDGVLVRVDGTHGTVEVL